jgi:hypothetical protein
LFAISDFDILDFNISDFDILDFDILDFDISDFDISDFDVSDFDISDIDISDIDKKMVVPLFSADRASRTMLENPKVGQTFLEAHFLCMKMNINIAKMRAQWKNAFSIYIHKLENDKKMRTNFGPGEKCNNKRAGANLAITSYKASAVKIYYATNSIVAYKKYLSFPNVKKL